MTQPCTIGVRHGVSCHQVDFDDATITSTDPMDPLPAEHVLNVTGGVAEPVKVTLVKAVYIRQPEHGSWR
jgi:hypothetical protein